MSATADFKIVEKPQKPLAMNPRKFALWLFIISITMLFAGLTSAYIVRRGEGNWVYFDLPVSLYVTTGIILLSSLTMHGAYLAAKRGDKRRLATLVTLTAALGIGFLIGQFTAWKKLVQMGVYLVGNPSGSFLYILTGLHGLHIISALVFLVIVLAAARSFRAAAKEIVLVQMCTTYWHFLGGLWVYLFLFLLIASS